MEIDDRSIPDPFKIPHRWVNKDEGMKFWPMLLYPEFFNYLMIFLSQPGSKDLNDYKNSKACSYHKSGCLYYNLTSSNFCILKGECRKYQSVNDVFINSG